MNESIEQIANDFQDVTKFVEGAYYEILKNREMIYEIALALHGVIPKENWDALNQKLVTISTSTEGKNDDKY